MSEEAKEVIAVIAGVVVLIAGYIKLFFPERSHKNKFIKKAEAKGHYKTAAGYSKHTLSLRNHYLLRPEASFKRRMQGRCSADSRVHFDDYFCGNYD